MGDPPDSSARPETRLERERVRRAVQASLFGGVQAPTQLGRFVVRKRLGEGALGVVYAGYDPKLGRDVALKVLRRGAGDVALLAEARALARLSHPNVLAVFEVDVADEIPFIVSELVAGGTLRAWLAAAPRTTDEVVGVLAEIGQGILAAHRRGLVHRDIKPENVLMGADGRPRVADFGLARSPSPEAVGAAGTPAYMAPEQRRGDRVDPLSDQFAFAVMAHEALFGGLPGATGAAPAEHPARALAPVLARGMAEVADARYPSMAELLAAFERARPGRRASRAWMFLAGAGVLVVVGGAARVATSEPAPPAAASATSGPARGEGEHAAGPLPSGEAGALYRQALAASEGARYEECATLLAARPDDEALVRFRISCAQQVGGASLGAACAAFRPSWGPRPEVCSDALARARSEHEAGRHEACLRVLEAEPATPLGTILAAQCAQAWNTHEGRYRSCLYMRRITPGPPCVDVREILP